MIYLIKMIECECDSHYNKKYVIYYLSKYICEIDSKYNKQNIWIIKIVKW